MDAMGAVGLALLSDAGKSIKNVAVQYRLHAITENHIGFGYTVWAWAQADRMFRVEGE
jgi:hypothetical protein